MADVFVNVESYDLRLQANAAAHSTRGQIRVYGKNKATGAVVQVHYYFRKAGVALGAPQRFTTPYLFIQADQPESVYQYYVDILRNEKPLTIVIADNNDTLLYTGTEAPGAHEIGA